MIMGADKKNPDPDIMKGQDAAATGHLMDPAGPLLPFSSGEDRSAYAPNMYAPQGQTFFYRGYDTPPGEWNEYPQFVNAEGLEIGSPGVYNENPSLMFHTGYGYSPQMPYGPYSPVTTPLPSVGDDSQLYSPHAYPFSGPPYYQQLVSPTMPYVTSPTQPSQPDITPMVRVDQQGDGRLHGPRPSYPPPMGSFSGGSFPGNFGFHDQTQGFNGLGSGGLWSDWSKPSDRQRPLTPLSPAVSPQPIGSLRPFSQLIGMNPQRQRAPYGFGSGSDSYNRGGYLQSSFNPSSSFGSISSLGPNAPGWLPLENSGRRGRTASSLCSCNGAALDILSEQNRGPRASKPKTQSSVEGNPTVDGSKNCPSNVKICGESCNRSDFVTDYEDAKFFVIKSYSEDNVHRSIKYGVWASTPNGNRKLDAAYREAKEKKGQCPVFLLFSVNASAQFCGVAEMVGPVDFERSVDYWQQDKWSGQLSVKWHIIKDVPNSQFRHIVLENNDNKPVTNSRDTQEVKLEQGIEMLKIFATYETNVSILDDFDYYEDRQKVMQERKARQQESSSLISANVIGGNEPKASAALPTGFIKQVSKSFAQAVRLDESGKEGEIAEKTDEVKLEDAITSTSAAETG